MPERSHLSIGEVLSLLREEFPDVTISKIRFLESQGLVDPERTPSGYRKFYDHDVERLRWILRQQREHFLPLKVIRGRLSENPEATDEEGESVGALPDVAGEDAGAASSPGRLTPRPADVAAVADRRPEGGYAAPDPPPDPEEGNEGVAPALFATTTAAGGAGAGTARVSAGAAGPANGSDLAGASRSGPGSASAKAGDAGGPARRGALQGGGGRTSRPGGREVPESAPAPAPARRGDDADSYSADELAAAAGATPALVLDLQRYGLITPHAVVGGTQYFDPSSLAVTRAAVGLSRFGIEARHLRGWRNAADREIGLFEQVIMPLLRQRNPQARKQAADTLAELAGLGANLRAALVEHGLSELR